METVWHTFRTFFKLEYQDPSTFRSMGRHMMQETFQTQPYLEQDIVRHRWILLF
jgi:hypothetical protein